MKTITIFGVGLIGGSLALSFKGKPDCKVIGHSTNPASVEKYIRKQVVDEATTDFDAAALAADIIFVCVPVGLLESYVERLNRLPLKPGCIITDVGSTKHSIVAFANGLTWSNGVSFIGGHPMAGKEQSGVEAATEHLYENAIYVLTPSAQSTEVAYAELEALLVHTRAILVKMDAEEHDEVVGAISHLPHMIAVGLVNQIHTYNDESPVYSMLAAGGFRDITRIASSDPVIWRDILMNNREVLLQLLQDWKKEMQQFEDDLVNENAAAIEAAFARANRFRRTLPERRKGVMTSMFDIYVDVPDHPGVIGQIATRLGEQAINLSNIEIMENRMDVPGVLRLSFRDEANMEAAIRELKTMGYPFTNA
jgi:prephenate dehydrogenase